MLLVSLPNSNENTVYLAAGGSQCDPCIELFAVSAFSGSVCGFGGNEFLPEPFAAASAVAGLGGGYGLSDYSDQK